MNPIGNFRLATDAQIDGLHKHPDQIKRYLFGADDEPTVTHNRLHEVEVDSDWGALHWLLTGGAGEGKPPLNFILGGREVGDVDVGSGPARTHSAAEVLAISQALARVDEKALKRHYKPKEMAVHGETVAAFEALVAHVQKLKELLTKAVEKKLGLVVYIT